MCCITGELPPTRCSSCIRLAPAALAGSHQLCGLRGNHTGMEGPNGVVVGGIAVFRAFSMLQTSVGEQTAARVPRMSSTLRFAMQLFVYGFHPVWRYRLRKIPGDHYLNTAVQIGRMVQLPKP